MPTSNYMPDVKVEIAWDGSFRTPMADWTWTDVSDYVELADGMNISWGRGDERSVADANTLTLTLDNSDGRFTAERVTSPYYPNVKVYRPIRVLATPVDGVEMPLFTGYITSWPVEWEDTDAYAKATITASSRLARLGLNARWRSIIEQTILADSPVVYYPLGDPEGSTLAGEASGNGGQPLKMVGDGTTVAFGQATGPGTDDLTAATFAGKAGPYQSGTRAMYLTGGSVTTTGDLTLEAFYAGPPTTLDSTVIAIEGVVSVRVDQDEVIASRIVAGVATDVVSAAASFSDGAVRHIVLTVTAAGAWSLYVDAAVVDTASSTAPTGTGAVSVGGGGGVARTQSGSIAHAAAYTGALSGARIAEHAAAGGSGFQGETTDARFVRYAAMAGIPAAEVNAEPGSTTMLHVDTTGQNIVDMLRLTEATEAGVMYDALDGTLTLQSRGHRYAATSVLTLDMAKHEVEADYSPRLDTSFLVNDITVTGVTTAHKVDEASIAEHGVASASLTTASEDDDEPLNLASWALLQFATPKPRVPTLTVNVTAQAAAYDAGSSTVSSADVMAVTIGDKVTVANHPQQASVSITDYFVEGGSFTIGPESFVITWNVSPSSPDDQALIVGDALRGVVGTNYVAL